MRRLGALIALIALGAAAYGQVLPEPRTIKINDRVYVLLGPIQHANKVNQGYMINSTVIVGDQGVILVDSGGSDEVGRPYVIGRNINRAYLEIDAASFDK